MSYSPRDNVDLVSVTPSQWAQIDAILAAAEKSETEAKHAELCGCSDDECLHRRRWDGEVYPDAALGHAAAAGRLITLPEPNHTYDQAPDSRPARSAAWGRGSRAEVFVVDHIRGATVFAGRAPSPVDLDAHELYALRILAAVRQARQWAAERTTP